MLADPDYNNISIENDKQEIFMTLMLELHVYLTNQLTLVYLEVIDKEYCQNLCFAYFEIYNGFASGE